MLDAMWRVMLSLAPWMLLGMAIAGVLHVALPRGLIRRRLGGPGGVLTAVALGVPLPLCSCGVIPAGLGLKKDGASNGATVGFLISTPQTGVDSILVSASFLGWPFAVFKLLSAAVTGLAGGWITNVVDGAAEGVATTQTPTSEVAPRRSLRDGVDHALMILRTIWGWIAFGVVASALIEVVLPAGFFERLAGFGDLLPILAALVISLPLYVCATASVPIAAALVAGGMPAGAALVFLMAGPATNVATVGSIFRALGARALAVYLTTIIAGSVLAALLFDFVIEVAPAATAQAHHDHAWWAVASAVVLLALMAWFALDGLRGIVARGAGRQSEQASIEISVTGMSCSGCVSKLQRALLAEDGVASVEVTLDPGRAVVRGSVDASRLRHVIEGAGFGVAEA